MNKPIFLKTIPAPTWEKLGIAMTIQAPTLIH